MFIGINTIRLGGVRCLILNMQSKKNSLVLTSRPWLKKPSLGLLRKLSHEQEINRFLDKYQGLKGFDFVDQVLEHYNYSYGVSQRYRANISATGRSAIVANHPLGALDRLSLLKLVGEIRRDVKIVANGMLLRLAELITCPK